MGTEACVRGSRGLHKSIPPVITQPDSSDFGQSCPPAVAPSSSEGRAHDSLLPGSGRSILLRLQKFLSCFSFSRPHPHPTHFPARDGGWGEEGFSLDGVGQSLKERCWQMPRIKTLQGGAEPCPSLGRILGPESRNAAIF